MRTISFRGMDINGKWHYGLLAESAGFPKQPDVGVYISNTAGFPWAFQVRIETVGQCTGLRDKNGKWIYEGDIVTEHHGGLMFEPDFYQIQVVEWKEFGFMPFMRVIGEVRHDFANNLKEFIVIDNVWENPNLIK